MPAYKDKNKGTWYVSFHYFDWTGKNVRKMKRGFATKKEAVVLQIKLCSILQIIWNRFWCCYVNIIRLFGVDSALCFI
ncbi:MAG: Arm DNA-binding domain-containing protein [Lachnospiraceae bacterium]|nr:Arm DNA-binding domain-containing protein [Lachnospiraceae bacterium]